MVYTALDGFVEFKNTENAKKQERIEGTGDLSITARKTRQSNGKYTITLRLSGGLIKSMNTEGFSRFKLLFKESTGQIAIRPDTTSKCIDLSKYKLTKAGALGICDKYITYTLLPMLNKEKLNGYKYTGKLIKNQLYYIFDVNKKL